MSLSNFTGLHLGLSIFLYISFSFYIPSVAGSLQQVTFFESIGCSGERNVTFTSTEIDLNSTWVGNASSVHILGVWSITVEKALENGGSPTRTVVHHNTAPPHGFCAHRDSDWYVIGPEDYQFVSAVRKGPADMTTSQIIFYTGREFSGVEYVFDQKETSRMPTGGSVAMLSYINFSNDEWMVYPLANFTGEPVHFKPFGRDVPKDYFELIGFFLSNVGSVKKVIRDVVNDKAAGCTKNINVMLLYLMILAIFKFAK